MDATATHQLRDAIAGEIRAEMARRKLTQTQLARALGSNTSSVSRKLNGYTPLDVDELEAICRFLGVSIADLLNRANDVISWRPFTLAA